MDFIDKIRNLATRVPGQLDFCTTEEATKNALIMPFINMLGYDVFNPREVVPEFTADLGTKKGEKVDYAVFQEGQPIMLFECKWSGANLNNEHASQLYRYFSAVSQVRFGVLTNGVEYRFYSDLEARNIMDDKPFFIFNMLDFQNRQVEELKKFTKSVFDLDEILAQASELKYTAAIRKILAEEFEKPSEDFVVFLARQVYSGRMTQTTKDQFTEITYKALRRFLSEKINERLKQALEETEQPKVTKVEVGKLDKETESTDLGESVVRVDKTKGIVTTEDEIEGYFVVKSILHDVIDLTRVHMRDAKHICNVLLDDSIRKPVLRMHFNRPQKYIGLFDEQKKEERIPIDNVDDIYNYAAQILATVKRYDSQFGIPAQKAKLDATGTIQGRKTKYTGKKLLAIHFQGQRYAVVSWKEGMMTLLELLRAQNPSKFEAIAPTMAGRKRPYITPDSSQLVSAERIPNTAFYVEKNLSARRIANFCFDLVAKMEFSEADLAFETD
jgi:hypothetical protein